MAVRLCMAEVRGSNPLAPLLKWRFAGKTQRNIKPRIFHQFFPTPIKVCISRVRRSCLLSGHKASKVILVSDR
jgi:hypothetical protein